MIRRTSPETVVMNCLITEVSRESGNLKYGIFADPRNCCANDPPDHAEAISQEFCMAISKHFFASTRYRFTSRQIWDSPGNEIPTRTMVHAVLQPWDSRAQSFLYLVSLRN